MFFGVGDVTIRFFLEQMSSLSIYGKSASVNFASSAVLRLKDADAVLFVDYPKKNDIFFKKAILSKKPLFLLVWESEIINPKNTETASHYIFKKIFTYDDRIIDGIKYIKVPYSFNIPKAIEKKFEGKLLCCLIAGNKYSYEKKQLYSERRKIINWFEENAPKDFSLFGRGWNKVIPPRNIIDKFINKYSVFNYFRMNIYSTYNGEVHDKAKTLSKYKFSFCFENYENSIGYISEKIFDSFFSGCVPVYFGCNNITNYIPKECFIDYKAFNCISELHRFMAMMDKSTYNDYLYSIEKYLNSDLAFIFSNQYFSNSIINNIKMSILND
jgi:hypothetical protein